MIAFKKHCIFFIMMTIIVGSLYADENKQCSSCITDEYTCQPTEINSWRKRSIYLLGLINGFYLPLTSVAAYGLNVIDFSHPVMRENLEPFVRGATVGVGCWFVYKIIEWYMYRTILKAFDTASKNPLTIKVVHENDLLQQIELSIGG